MITQRNTFLAALLLLPIGARAEAHTINGEWSSLPPRLRASATSFPSGSTARSTLGVVESRFLVNPSEFWYDQTYGDTSVSTLNLQNEVWIASITRSYANVVLIPGTSFILVGDVVIASGRTTSMNKTSIRAYSSSASRSLQTTLMHEVGHFAGLGHEDDVFNVMGEHDTVVTCNGQTCRAYLAEDACDGLVDIYGRYAGGSIEDVSATVFKYSDSDGTYSIHELCDFSCVPSGGTPCALTASWYNGQWRYNVHSGRQYDVEFTYENNGETTQTVTAGWYISTNSTISTGDTLIATDTMTIGRNVPYTKSFRITIPSLSPGTYYLGVYMDHDNEISEVDGANNAAYHIIYVDD